MRRRTVPSVVLAGLLALTGCSTAGGSAGPSSSSSVSASGGFGEKPTVAVPSAAPPTTLQTSVLKEGDGPAVKKGDLVVVNYLGQTWEPKDGKPNVFDNSYDRKKPVGFSIGTGAVIPGWDKGLVGKKVGSRVLLTIPPAEGYGDQAQQAIPAKSTLVFVVDLLKALNVAGKAAAGTPAAPPAGFPTVKDAGAGKPPVVEGRTGPEPTAVKSAVYVRGTGAPLNLGGTLVAQGVQVNWKDGKVAGTTYGQGPLTLTADQIAGISGLPATLKGAREGTRVVVLLPTKEAGGTAGVLVLDLVGSY